MMFFTLKKGLNGQMHSFSDAHDLIKNRPLVKFPIPPPLGWIFSPPLLNGIWKTLISDISRVFWHTVNYTISGYMLNADGHLID